MPIRRPSFMVLKAGKKGTIKLAYESEHQHLAEDYMRQWGGVMIAGILEDMDVEIGDAEGNDKRRGRKGPPVMTEPYIKHEGAVPPPPNAVAPYMIPYGESLNRVFVALDDDESEAPERIVHQMDPTLMADVLSALEQAGSLEPEEE